MLGIVPARGGSKRLRRKNLQLVNGRPLVLIAADKLVEVTGDKAQVVISTDDDEIESVARSHGYQVHRRGTVPDDQTIVEAVWGICDDLGWDGEVLCLQPTVPNVTVDDLRAFGVYCVQHDLLACKGTVSGRTQTGVYWWAGAPYMVPVETFSVPSAWPDIDTVEDLHAARLKAQRKRIDIVYLEDDTHGTGHRHRAEALAAALAHHDVDVHAGTAYDVDADMVVTDSLDSPRPVYAPKWVTFENQHPDTMYADLVVNALYGEPPDNEWEPYAKRGTRWAVLRPEFAALPPYEVREISEAEWPRVLFMFGGTDPANLQSLAMKAWPMSRPAEQYVSHGGEGCVTYQSSRPGTIIQPGQPVPVAATMRQHDILVTSAGRTVFEAAAVGIPTIVMAQNNREATHTHLGADHGNIYLGLGRLVTPDQLRRTVETVAADIDLRRELSDTARRSIDGKGLARIVHAIDGILEGL